MNRASFNSGIMNQNGAYITYKFNRPDGVWDM